MTEWEEDGVVLKVLRYRIGIFKGQKAIRWGRLTALTTGADSRVKAPVPFCGGVDVVTSLKRISCPILFQSPSNDFYGRIDDLQNAVTQIQSKQWRATCAAHHNHQNTAKYEVAGQLAVEVKAEHRNTLIIGIDTFVAEVELVGGVSWQSIALSAADFHDGKSKMLKIGADWKAPNLNFKI